VSARCVAFHKARVENQSKPVNTASKPVNTVSKAMNPISSLSESFMGSSLTWSGGVATEPATVVAASPIDDATGLETWLVVALPGDDAATIGVAVTVGAGTIETATDEPGVAYSLCASAIDAAGVSCTTSLASAVTHGKDVSTTATGTSQRATSAAGCETPLAHFFLTSTRTLSKMGGGMRAILYESFEVE
jgi:hypothetical protein